MRAGAQIAFVGARCNYRLTSRIYIRVSFIVKSFVLRSCFVLGEVSLEGVSF